MFVYVYVYVHVYAQYIFMCMCRPEVSIRCLPLLLSILSFEARSLTECGAL